MIAIQMDYPWMLDVVGPALKQQIGFHMLKLPIGVFRYHAARVGLVHMP